MFRRLAQPDSMSGIFFYLFIFFSCVVWESSDGFGSREYTQTVRPSEIVPPTTTPTPPPGKNYAFVTLLTNDKFLVGVLTLGKSLLKHNSEYPRVCLITPWVSEESRKLARDSGWQVLEVEPIKNPHFHERGFQERLLWVFTKLRIFDVNFDKIVYLDADMIATDRIDEVFECGSFCSVMRDNHFNTGFMVIKPNHELFLEMLNDYQTTPSYNAGEQGFTNNHFPHLLYMPLFSPYTSVDSILQPGSRLNDTRLDSTYNGDVALYYMRGASWIHGKPKIIHFTMLHFKPWYWFEYFAFPLNWEWYEHMPLQNEPFWVTLSRFIAPWILGWSCIQSVDSLLAVFVGSWFIPLAHFIQDYPWIYALFGMVVQWVVLLIVALGLVPVIPGIPVVHPFISCLLYAEWFCVVIFTIGYSIARFHQWLGRMVPPSFGFEPMKFQSTWSLVQDKVFAIAITCLAFIMHQLRQLASPAMILVACVFISGVILLLSVLYHRLPLIGFRVGQANLVRAQPTLGGEMIE